MTRNGAIAARFAQAVTRRLAPHTGITQKMLARQAGGMSDDTLARYLADASTIPAAAVQACDAAFHHFKLPPGFLQEVMGGGAGEGPPTGGSAPVRLWGQQAGADLCFVATHEGSLHSAPLGPGAAVRQYVGLPAQSRADCVSLGLDQLGWVFAGLAQDCIALRFNTDLVAPRAADRAAAWLSLQGGARVEMLGETMPRAEAMTRLAAVAARRRAEASRRLLRIEGVTAPAVPEGVDLAVEGVSPWETPSEDFYLIDTTFIKPTIEPAEWSIRIHGMVERELTLTYRDLVAREITQDWITLSCVSNPVGGDLVGNAWWSGVRLATILAEAGPHPDADAVLQTSEDGWTCGTPLAPLMDGRNAMLAVAMNGEPLPIEHGFPVRTIVPGLYGYVSATKWVVDLEVTTFDRFTAYWTEKGWGERGPVKIASRIDVPRSGDDLPAGEVLCAGVAWFQHSGISAVQVQVDGGSWEDAELATVASTDTWVQWRRVVSLDEGEHQLRVRAVDRDGNPQTGVVADVLPDGATGWHTIDVTAKA